MRLVVADEAKADIEGIADFIASESPRAAQRLVASIREQFRFIVRQPFAYPVVPDLSHRGVRRKVSGSYVIFYRVADRQVEILHVIHGARDYVALIAGD